MRYAFKKDGDYVQYWNIKGKCWMKEPTCYTKDETLVAEARGKAPMKDVTRFISTSILHWY